MAKAAGEGQDLESTTVGIYRTATVVRGGRRFSFGALVVVGNRQGEVGLGYAKAPGVPAAIEKAQKQARKQIERVPLIEGTIPHPVSAKFCASHVRLIPAAPGSGVTAGGTVRAVLELAGVRDCLTKSFGSNNKKNLCKAVLAALRSLHSKEVIERERDIEVGTTEVERRIEIGRKYVPRSGEGGESGGSEAAEGSTATAEAEAGQPAGAQSASATAEQPASDAEQSDTTTGGQSS